MTRGYSLEKDLSLLSNLAARSEVFDRLLYNGMKESYETQISFPKINSSGMEIVLEYTYTGSIKNESLTKDNIIEAFYAADYFQLPDLQDFIMKGFKNTLRKNPTENYSPELLSKFAGKMPLTEDNILLNLLVETVVIIPFNTIEFGTIVYCRTNESDYVWDETACGSKLIIEDNGKVIRASKSLGSWRSVRAKMILENNGIYEWDVIIEKACCDSWIGVASENLNYEKFSGNQLTGWALGSAGYCYNSENYIGNYCPPFGDGARITVHLDMIKRTCAFTVNSGTKYQEVPSWNNLPSKLYPVASLYYPGQFRIQPHKKNI
ncbi:unnamed protein product [Rhizophagus irregularis]|uniref:B30.2/SPRY domain-containing protein n=1 Tax=Rhizophagus irregularis TaxID=588596 RepID=A0A915Z0I8_9GLOM|nr:unnamed protein product [Rhizophagus irregularis]